MGGLRIARGSIAFGLVIAAAGWLCFYLSLAQIVNAEHVSWYADEVIYTIAPVISVLVSAVAWWYITRVASGPGADPRAARTGYLAMAVSLLLVAAEFSAQLDDNVRGDGNGFWHWFPGGAFLVALGSTVSALGFIFLAARALSVRQSLPSPTNPVD